MDFLIYGKKGGGKTIYCVKAMVEAMVVGRHCTSNIVLLWDRADYLVKISRRLVSVPRKPDGMSKDRYQEILKSKNPLCYSPLVPAGYRGIDAYTLQNFAVKCDRSFYHFLATEDQIYEPHKYVVLGESEVKPSLLVLEELNKYFPARQWASNQKKAQEFMDFVVEARHYCVDCLFIIQAPKNLDVSIIRQISQCWSFHDWRASEIKLAWGALGSFKFPRFLHCVTIRKFYPDDMHHEFSMEAFYVDKKLYGCYDTHAIAGDVKPLFQPATDAKNEVRALDLRRRKFAAVALVILAPSLLFVGCLNREKSDARRLISQMERIILASSNVVSRAQFACGALPFSSSPGLTAPVVITTNPVPVKTWPRSVVVDGFWMDTKGDMSFRWSGFVICKGDWWDYLGGYLETANEHFCVVRRADGQLYGISICSPDTSLQSRNFARVDGSIEPAGLRGYSPQVTQ